MTNEKENLNKKIKTVFKDINLETLLKDYEAHAIDNLKRMGFPEGQVGTVLALPFLRQSTKIKIRRQVGANLKGLLLEFPVS